MLLSRTEAKVVKAWREAAADLNFDFTSPFVGTTVTGVSFEALGLVHHFGRRIGTLIQVGGEPSADEDYLSDERLHMVLFGPYGLHTI